MLSGSRPLSAVETGAVRRQMNDLHNPPGDCEWREAEAVRAVQLFSALRHWKGEWHGQPMTLQPWQEELIVAPLFGWYRGDGRRRFTTGYVEVPRKNGKTTLIAGMAIQGLIADQEPGAEIYAAATKRDQATLMFTDAKNMIMQSAELMQYCRIYRHSIVCERLNSVFKPVSSESHGLHGLNSHRNLIDELHAHKTRDVWDVLKTGTGSRRNPLTLAITTAGYDRSTICWEQHEISRNVLEGFYEDNRDYDSHFAFMAHADPDDDILDEATWRKANPNFGVSVKPEQIAEAAAKANQSAAAENTFRMLHLNQWVQQAVRWLPMHLWDKCGDGELDIADYYGRPCWVGLDLASTRDVNSAVLCFPEDDGGYTLIPYFWAPEDVQDTRGQQDRRQVVNWGRRGQIKLTSGNVTDYDCIAHDIIDLSEKFVIQKLAFDPWGAAQSFVQRLQDLGFPLNALEEFRQTIGHFAAPTKEFERLVIAQKLRHFGNPVLRWMAGNVAVRQDPAGNIRPDKEKSADKIDGIVAAIMALSGAMEGDGGSVYDKRGILTL
jgi:phage terminase large subunit-like protein